MLGALYYPKGTPENPIDFDSLYIPYIYKEIYLEGIYNDITNGRTDMLCLDIGANIGIVTQYLRKFSKQIYAVEPSTEHYEALEKNVEFNGWTNVKPIKAAIADKDGEMTLNLHQSNRTCHSLTLDYKQGGEKVKTISFETLLKENNIEKVDFCKFDTEGAEEMILMGESFARVADKVKAIMVEFHFQDFTKIVQHLLKLGYEARRYPASAIIVLFTRP